MSLDVYTIDELEKAGKARVQSSGLALGTEKGSDAGTTIQVAAQSLQGMQVAAAYAYDQLLPSTMDAQSREDEMRIRGITFAKGATYARGKMGFAGLGELAVGTVVDFPASCFPDARARSYRTLTAYEPRADIGTGSPSTTITAGIGCTRTRVRLRAASHLSYLREGDYVAFLPTFSSGADLTSSYITSVSRDGTFDVWPPFRVAPDDGIAITAYGTASTVDVECTEPGTAGNVGAFYYLNQVAGDPLNGGFFAMVGAGGGGEEVPEIDPDTARVIRVMEDTRACPPGAGNVQHWREIALACPDVALDDAIVYSGLRGPGSIDIVAIGKRSLLSVAGYPGARVDFASGGGNGRVISTVQAARVQSHCQSFASYYDDIRVLPVRWDFRGQGEFPASTSDFFKNVGCVDVKVSAARGYGPDCGVAWRTEPDLSVTDHSALYVWSGDLVPAEMKPGHRVWFRLSSDYGDPEFSIVLVTSVVSVGRDRKSVTVPDFSAFKQAIETYRTAPKLWLRDWGTAGAVTQPCIDALCDYYDGLGPGSQLVPDYGPGYQRAFASTVSGSFRPYKNTGVKRWPIDGHRWNSGVRSGLIKQRLLSIEGVVDVQLPWSGGISARTVDYDPDPTYTAALSWARVVY